MWRFFWCFILYSWYTTETGATLFIFRTTLMLPIQIVLFLTAVHLHPIYPKTVIILDYKARAVEAGA